MGEFKNHLSEKQKSCVLQLISNTVSYEWENLFVYVDVTADRKVLSGVSEHVPAEGCPGMPQ